MNVALAVGVLLSAAMTVALREPYHPRWQDFAVYYRAAQAYFYGHGDPYAPNGQFPFVYSYVWLWLMRPLISLPLDKAAVATTGVMMLVLFASLAVMARTARFLGASAWQLGALVALVCLCNQMPLFTSLKTLNAEPLCVMFAALALAHLDADLAFGALVAACAALKPHYALLVVPALVLERRIVPALLAGAGVLLVDVLPFALRPGLVHGFLTSLGRQSLEHGCLNPSIGATLLSYLHFRGQSGSIGLLVFLILVSLGYFVVARRFWGRLSPEGRIFGTLLYFVLVTPRLKDYSLDLLFLPMLAELRGVEHPADLRTRPLLVGAGIVGVAWGFVSFAMSNPMPVFRMLWPLNLGLVVAMLAREPRTLLRTVEPPEATAGGPRR